MMKNRIFSLMILFFAVAPFAMAQNIVYVSNGGEYYKEGVNDDLLQFMGDDTFDGLSWKTPKLTIQEAINTVAKMPNGGEVWVAQGTYYPTESMDPNKSKNDQYYSFKIPAGVTVRGGFQGWENNIDKRASSNSDAFGISYTHRTILSGDIGATSSLTWDAKKQQYTTSFSGNSFHVVWFGDLSSFTDGRAASLSGTATLEGCFIKGGNASFDNTSIQSHASYGGGIYMVEGAVVENCYVTGCSAARDGGGIYMDGGGTVTHTAVVKCQALGLGITYGFGGGICVAGNEDRKATIDRCGVSGCVGRMGGGIAVLASSADNKDALKVTSTVIVNNTATTEAGGIYTEKGGVLSHLTVARNRCNGTGVYINKMTTGRSAGLYCRDNATVVNSVFWGGKCSANNDVQYANSRSDKSIQVVMKYVGLSNTSNIDWSSTYKVGINKLSTYNSASEASGATVSKDEGYPLFNSVLSEAGTYDTTVTDDDGNPVTLNVGEYNLYHGNWHPKPTSTINNRGIDNVLNTGTTCDLVGDDFSARCTLGAYHIDAPTIDADYADDGSVNIYVDPNATAVDTDDDSGKSWDLPARFLGDALDFVRDNLDGTEVNIYVKQGTVDNTRSDMSSVTDPNGVEGEDVTDIRNCVLQVPSNVKLYGGYSSDLKGNDISTRNPVLYPTIISANIDDTYKGNVKTLVYFGGVSNVVLDGFQIRYANNSDSEDASYVGVGGALRFDQGAKVTVKNCVVAGCYANNGAAVYATGDGDIEEEKTEITFENCIFHNNEISGVTTTDHGIVYLDGNSSLSFDHCDLLHNAGVAIVNGGIGDVNIENSVFYANMSAQNIKDTNGYGSSAAVAFANKGTGSFTSTYNKNLFDSNAGTIADGLTTSALPRLSYTFDNKVGTTYPLFLNSTRTAGVSTGGYYSDDTYYGRATSFQPLNLNPMVNAAYYAGSGDFGTDMSTVVTRNYGGLPDIGAIENHLTLAGEGELGNDDGQYGYGDVLYVRDYRDPVTKEVDLSAGGDGYSWENAINGNAYYFSDGTHGAQKITTIADGYTTQTARYDYAGDPDDPQTVGIVLKSGNYYLTFDGSKFACNTTNVYQATRFKFTRVKGDDNYILCNISAIVNNSEVAIGFNHQYNLVIGTNAIWKLNNSQSGYISVTKECESCNGTGKSGRNNYCNDCHGTGLMARGRYLSQNGLSGNQTQWNFEALVANSTRKFSGVKGLQYAVNAASTNYADTRSTSTLEDPVVSTSVDEKIAEHKYYIGMLQDNAPGNDVYFAYGKQETENNQQVWHMYGTTKTQKADEYVLLTAGEHLYYIYNLTKKQYVVYTGTNFAGGLVQLAQSNTKNATWYVFPINEAPDYRTYTIIPGSESYAREGAPSWNYYGGVYNSLGLYQGTDHNGKWQFWTVPESTTGTLSHTNKEVWVAAGEYAKDPETISGTFGLDIPTTNGVAAHDESCYIMRDGVDVYGSFPSTGNPGMEHRVPLISDKINLAQQYAENKLEGESYDEFVTRYKALYETILEPETTTRAYGAVRRVLAPAHNYNIGNDTDVDNGGLLDNGFNGATWDGFTLRYGNVDANKIKESRLNGAAGVAVYQHSTVKNCVITDNVQFAPNGVSSHGDGYRAGGVFIQGGNVINCYVINNQMLATSESDPYTNGSGSAPSYGAGMYLYYGTVYNCVIANNYNRGALADGGGVFVDQVCNFFNNTIVNNKSVTTSGEGCGGFAVFTNGGTAESHITIYNSIIANNEGKSGGVLGDRNILITNAGYVSLNNCLVDDVPEGNKSTSGSSVLEYDYCQEITGGKIGDRATNYGDLFKSFSNGSSGYAAYGTDFKTLNLRLNDNATQAINKGDDMPVINGVEYDLSTYTDMDYKERIQDCTIDIGAYEYNDAKSIQPTFDDADNTIASFYVTPNGNGLATGDSPENAACADKLQAVLDAAGRYKYQNKDKQVIVKVATYRSGKHFQYYAKYTTDTDNDDARVYSIMVPRGVEVWGGYTDAYTSPTDNGFVGYVATAQDVTDGVATAVGDLVKGRDVINHQTYFDSYYYNKSKEAYAYTYHVLTFTDKVFDPEHNPYLSTEEERMKSSLTSSSTGALNETYLSLKDNGGVTDRAVVDGIFITGGKADIKRTTDYNTKVNINSYGGAAIVTDFAHVRNCIVRSNEGTYGGALALAGHALVSGCLIDQNTAEYGGGIYVFENGTKLSDGTTINTTAGSSDETYTENMPLVYTSTIVNNYAKTQGGGIWFGSDDANLRVNSSLIWQNSCKDESDIAGLKNPVLTDGEQVSATNFYPFSYSAFLNMTVAGVNNQSLMSNNADGVRFTKGEDDETLAEVKTSATNDYDPSLYDEFGYYRPTFYSALLRRGMSLSSYQSLETSLGLSVKDFADAGRRDGNRKYIDIGARARVKELPNGDLMLRIYVADSKFVNSDAVKAMVASKDSYYSQEGSSFAYPMTNLQDALDYIVYQRQRAASTDEDDQKRKDSNNLPFEIIMSKGDYVPSTSLSGSSDYTVANTFAIPEGVSLYGGFYSLRNESTNTYYGKYLSPNDKDNRKNKDITKNVQTYSGTGSTIITASDGTKYTLTEIPSDDMLSNRLHDDMNSNGIFEPWEYMYQTNLMGNAETGQKTGAYHIVTIVPDANVVGTLPLASATNDGRDSKTPKEVGQPVVFDGISFMNGYGHNYQNKAMDESGVRTYFQGGAILVDGNRSGATTYNAVSGVADGVGYRDIPVYIAKCYFNANNSGLGGAISTNTSTNLFSDYFAQNMAESNSSTESSETVSFTNSNGVTEGDKSLQYPGVGGAIYYTGNLYIANTIFANNEASDKTFSLTPSDYTAFSNPTVNYISGVGGALFGGSYSHLYMTNCDVVRNQANIYPALFTLNPNAASSTNEVVNSVLWGNEQNTLVTNTDTYKFAGNLVINYGLKDRGTAAYTFSSAVPSSQEVLDAGNYTESIWYSAYESGRGMKAVNTVSKVDEDYTLISDLVTLRKDQNCNINVSTKNNLLEGPNFKAPSTVPGYEKYNPSSDWSPMRISNLTDNGSGRIAQVYDSNNNTYSFSSEESKMSGLYSAVRNANAYSKKYMAIGSDRYMEVADDEDPTPINRISLDYKVNSQYLYVDMGAYEYIRTEPKYSTEDNVDIMWVAQTDKGAGTGQYWEDATSDIQTCINTLLSLRNGRRKEIRFESKNVEDGGSEFTPLRTTDGLYSFVIDTKAQNVASQAETKRVLTETPESEAYQRYVESITFKGGYSYDSKYSDKNNTVYTYDVEKYPATIRGKNRDDGDVSSDMWNHIFYIKDASQRYGFSSKEKDPDAEETVLWYKNGGYGWWPNSGVKGSTGNPTTVPVEFDGLTIVNNQTLPGAEGAAIYYADQSFDENTDPVSADKATYFATATSSIQFTQTVQKTNLAKLVISKCKIVGCGSRYDASSTDKSVSAVYVSKYGGEGLIYNSIFHSNYGCPLVAYDTRTVNNTFALNAGKVDLRDYQSNSSILNSVMWKNNADASKTSGYDVQFSLPVQELSTFNHNAYTDCPVTSTDYNSDDVIGNNYNVSLSTDNSDIISGPNFVDPDNDDIESRDFAINPSIRLFNRGLNSNYDQELTTTNTIYDYAVPSTVAHDILGNDRIKNGTIDLGAVEFESALARIIYVDPNKTKTGYDGTSWTQNNETKKGPMALTQLQSAIDLAAVYKQINGQSAYVFVKGANSTSKDLHTGESIILRDGVQIYASLPAEADAMADCEDESDDKLKPYVAKVLGIRQGIASSAASKTYVYGISTGDVDFASPTVVDGLVVAPSSSKTDSKATVSSPVINITPSNASDSHLALRNVIVSGFTVSSGNLANIDGALLYEALFHGNTISNGSALKLGDNGYAVNVTVEGATTGKKDGDKLTNVMNSIVNFTDNHQFSGYNYSLSDANLNYQLSEGSKYIDASIDDPGTLPIRLKTDDYGKSVINYTNDFDLLGNPRLLSGVSSANTVDQGAFETWRIDKSNVTTASSSNFYPHDGSVVYVMEGNNLVCGTSFAPGYLLLKDGASLYGNQQNVNLSYVAVERADVNKDGSVVSMPYAMNYLSDVTVPTVNAETGVTTLDKDGSTVYTYNGSSRADWQYSFAKSGSSCWEAVSNKSTIDACQGVLYVPNANHAGKTLRFTANSGDMSVYVYSETSSETNKTVDLAVFNDASSTSGAADFTSKENMGWNCIGLPYLVSDYKPYAEKSTDVYMMDAPHKMWLYYDGTQTPDGTTTDVEKGGYYPVSSWDDADWHVASDDVARIWAGEGFFVQNAKWSGDETLTFYRPVYSGSAGAAKRVNARYLTSGSEQTEEEMIADESASDVKVYVQKHTLYVQNITDGADIAVYMTNGKAELTDHTENNEYSVTLENGVHIVKVNGKSFKVYVK